MSHDELQADLCLYALGALAPDELQVFENHLAGCDLCRRELDEWQAITALIGLDAGESPAPDLQPRLRARVRQAVTPLTQPRPIMRRRAWLRTALPLAAGVALVLLAGRERWSQQQLERERQHNAILTAALASRDQQLAAVRAEIAEVHLELQSRTSDLNQIRAALARAEDGLAALAAPQLRMIRLQHTPEATPRRAHALLDLEHQRALFFAFDLAPLPPDQAYELWWITEDRGPVNGGVFRPDERGVGRVSGALPPNLDRIKAAAVTIEPAAGVAAPSGPMILLGKI